MQFAFLQNLPSAPKLGAFLLLAAVTCGFYLDLCALYFQCGCRSWWAGAASQCNIHHAGVKHCPLCMLSLHESLAFVVLILSVQGDLIRRGRLLWAAIAFPMVAAVEALLLGWYRGYWD